MRQDKTHKDKPQVRYKIRVRYKTRKDLTKQANRDMLLVSTSVNDLMQKMSNYKAPEITHIINKVVS